MIMRVLCVSVLVSPFLQFLFEQSNYFENKKVLEEYSSCWGDSPPLAKESIPAR